MASSLWLPGNREVAGMRTGTKDDVCVVRRCDLMKKRALALSPLLPALEPVLESDVVGYFIHSFGVPYPALNAVHGCATDAPASGTADIQAAKGCTVPPWRPMSRQKIHVPGTGDGERVHTLTFAGYRMEEMPTSAPTSLSAR